MENNIISIEQHKNYRKPTLWLPDRPACQVYDCKRMFREMRKQRSRQSIRETSTKGITREQLREMLRQHPKYKDLM
jgi:hypothetical protein